MGHRPRFAQLDCDRTVDADWCSQLSRGDRGAVFGTLAGRSIFSLCDQSAHQLRIIMVGMVLAFGALSISWDNVQWLATALTFGLAFGLQEIFANFVAGIILMFERPIRIGDWITVDEFTGVVTKIVHVPRRS